MNFIKKFLPPGTIERIRSAVLFRAEDVNNLHQVLPQRVNTTTVERIQGFRYPAPGSRVGARIPIRENSDQIYDIAHFTRDPRNLPKKEEYLFPTSEKPLLVTHEEVRLPSHGKRKITLLPYDPSGLRTTKTVTWEALDKVLISNAAPDHLPRPDWADKIGEINEERERKGLPPAIGRRNAITGTDNYTEVRW